MMRLFKGGSWRQRTVSQGNPTIRQKTCTHHFLFTDADDDDDDDDDDVNDDDYDDDVNDEDYDDDVNDDDYDDGALSNNIHIMITISITTAVHCWVIM